MLAGFRRFSLRRILFALMLIFMLSGPATLRDVRAQGTEPVFFATASGVVALGAKAPVWYATRLSLTADSPIPDPAAGAAGFVLVTEGSVAVIDQKSKQPTLLQTNGATFINAGADVNLAAAQEDATIWRIAVVADGETPPFAEGNGIPRPLSTTGTADPTADSKAVRSIELRLGSLATGDSANLGDDGWAAPLVGSLVGAGQFSDGSTIGEGRFVAVGPSDTAIEITADAGPAVIGYVAMSPSLDPDALGASGASLRAGTEGVTPTPFPAQSGGNSNPAASDAEPTPEPTATPTPDTGDDDADGLTNAEEAELGTNPNNPDTDVDGLSDGQEVHELGTNPLLTDTDSDGLSDGDEVLKNVPVTSPTSTDSDFDGLKDGDEVAVYHTNPGLFDTDTDGIGDGDEIATGTDPLVLTDSDGDLLGDGLEAYYGTNPENPDSDEDQLTDLYELFYTFTDPNRYDTDGDGTGDAVENASGTDPLDPNSHP